MNRIEGTAGSVDGSAEASRSADPVPNPDDIKAWSAVLAVIAIGLAAIVAIFGDTTRMFLSNWHQASFNHGFLILPISLYVAWERRAAFLPLRPRPTLWGLLPAVAMVGVWVIGHAASVNLVQQVGMLGLIQVLIFCVLGWRISVMLMFPILYLLLMLPVGEALYIPLQLIAADTSTFLIRLTEVPVFQNDTVLQIPTGIYRVAQECAGLNFLLATIALTLLYCNIMYRGWLKPLIGIAVMVPFAIIGNGVRIFLIIYANHHFGANIDIVADHYFYGWGFIAIILFVMMWVGLAFRDPEPDYGEASKGVPPAGFDARRLLPVAGAAAVVVALAAAGPAWTTYRADTQPSASPAVSLDLPQAVGAWTAGASRPQTESWQPRFPGADSARMAVYGAEDAPDIDLFVAYYAYQSGDKEVVSYRNDILEEGTWVRQSRSVADVTIDGRPAAVVEERLDRLGVLRVIWYVYWIDGRFTASQHVAKALQAKTELLFGDRRAAFVAVSVVEETDRHQSRETLRRFLGALPDLKGMLAGATPDVQAD